MKSCAPATPCGWSTSTRRSGSTCSTSWRRRAGPKEFGLDIGPWISYGAWPRATLYLTTAAKAHAFIQGRGYVTPDDIKALALDVLRHRILTTYEAEAREITAEQLATQILEAVPVP